MKLLAQLEKKKTAWVLIAFCVVFFFLRLPSLIEPYWYGDEGIYEVVGQAMDHGRILYRDIWDNKPPLLYAVYAIAQGDQPTVKSFSLVVGLFTLLAFFFLAQKILIRPKAIILATTLFTLLFATPVLEANIANAENFILLPIILAGTVLYTIGSKQRVANPARVFFIGLLLGLAFLFKIVAIFDLAAFLLFLVVIHLPEKLSVSSLRKTFISQKIASQVGMILLGFLMPFFLCVIYFASTFALSDFFHSVFFDNVGYVGWENILWGIPQGFLIVKAVLLLLAVIFILRLRKSFTAPMLFIATWLIFSLFNVYFSGRPYTHYAIVLLPSFCLFIGLLFTQRQAKEKLKIAIVGTLLVGVLSYYFGLSLNWSYLYYQNVLAFISGQKTTEAYQSFFDHKVPRDYAVATFISNHTTDEDSVFIWGNNPQIYALSQKLPLGKYTVAYHVAENNAYDQTQEVLNKTNPKYIIVLDETQPLPFVIPLYIMRYTIPGATIYERSL